VRIRQSQFRRRIGGIARVLLDRDWTEWLPIYAWAVEHAEGIIVVDTGETARATESGYYPGWHPYYRRAMQIAVTPEQELGPQLEAVGIARADVRVAVLTHLHTDHTGGLEHLAGVRVMASRRAYANAVGPTGRLQGYMPQHWPAWFAPDFIRWKAEPAGPFARSCAVTDAGDVLIVPTPGHTPGHVSVIVREENRTFFLAGDTSYTLDSLMNSVPDGLTPAPRRTTRTQEQIRDFAAQEPTVYLPSHDPESETRLHRREALAIRSEPWSG
jgi:glyoxylase-like metal-dependent hydrolase (beta-lactamase superfamily II)